MCNKTIPSVYCDNDRTKLFSETFLLQFHSNYFCLYQNETVTLVPSIHTLIHTHTARSNLKFNHKAKCVIKRPYHQQLIPLSVCRGCVHTQTQGQTPNQIKWQLWWVHRKGAQHKPAHHVHTWRWTQRVCVARLALWLNSAPHTEHKYGFLPAAHGHRLKLMCAIFYLTSLCFELLCFCFNKNTIHHNPKSNIDSFV